MRLITDWSELSPALFEKLCAEVLSKCGYKNIQWFGEVGSDKGRDIIASKTDSPVPGIERTERWMIQCKRYTVKKLSKVEIKNLLDSALEHDIENVLIIVTASLSANIRDWLSGAIKKYPFNAYVWEDLDFRREVIKYKSELLESLPELSEGKEPLWIYPMNRNEVRFGCNDVEDVEIVVSNTEDIETAKIQATEFLRYIKANGFEWWN